MKKYSVLLAGLLIFISCNQTPKSNQFKVEGFLSNGQNRTLVLNEISPEGNIFIDTIRIDENGEFEYTYTMPYPSFYTLQTDKGEFITLIPDYREVIGIEGDYDTLSPSYVVKGSMHSQLLWALNDKELEGIAILNDIYKTWDEFAYHEESVEIKKQLDSLYYETWHDQKAFYYNFILDNKGSLATLMALYKTFNKRTVFPVEANADLYDTVNAGLSQRLPDNPHTKHFLRSYRRKTVSSENTEQSSQSETDGRQE